MAWAHYLTGVDGVRDYPEPWLSGQLVLKHSSLQILQDWHTIDVEFWRPKCLLVILGRSQGLPTNSGVAGADI